MGPAGDRWSALGQTIKAATHVRKGEARPNYPQDDVTVSEPAGTSGGWVNLLGPRRPRGDP
jgi:hypothetical protein